MHFTMHNAGPRDPGQQTRRQDLQAACCSARPHTPCCVLPVITSARSPLLPVVTGRAACKAMSNGEGQAVNASDRAKMDELERKIEEVRRLVAMAVKDGKPAYAIKALESVRDSYAADWEQLRTVQVMDGRTGRTAVQMLAAALLTSGRLGSQEEGILKRVASGKAYAPRPQLVQHILLLAVQRQVVLLRGPSFSGKTSLLQLAYLSALEANKSSSFYTQIVYVKASNCSENMSWNEFMRAAVGETWDHITSLSCGRVLFFIDELQTLYHRKPEKVNALWSTIKAALQNSPDTGNGVHIIAAALFEGSPSQLVMGSQPASSPFHIGPAHIISLQPSPNQQLGLALTDSEYHQLFSDTWAQHSLPSHQLFAGNKTRDAIMDLSGGHVGNITSMLDQLLDNTSALTGRPEEMEQLLHQCADNNMGVADVLFERSLDSLESGGLFYHPPFRSS